MNHSTFFIATLGYKANNLEPGLDKRDNTIKIWHTKEKKFVLANRFGAMLAASVYVDFALTLINN